MISTSIFLLVIPLLSFTVNVYSQSNGFFRKDYKFIDTTDAFYKFHTIHRTWADAKKRCALEGAQLFYPENKPEVDAIIAFWNKTQPQFWHVYVGISDLLVKGVFETIDGKPVTDVYSEWGPGEPNDAGGVEDCVVIRNEGSLNDDSCTKKYPFICKRTKASVEWNFFCDLPDPTYQYDHTLGKCYKFHLTPMNWTDAYSVCSAEQSYLAVLNSEKESKHLVKMTEEAPKDKIGGDYLRGAVHLGFHNKDGEGWKTIRGTTLAESGFSVWGGGQPDGGDKEPCGTMFYNGQLNDLACDRKCFFICEHDIGTLNSAVDERNQTDSRIVGNYVAIGGVLLTLTACIVYIFVSRRFLEPRGKADIAKA